MLWRDVEVVRRGGPPQLQFHGGAARRFAAMGGDRSLLTITHSDALALAQVLLLGAEPTQRRLPILAGAGIALDRPLRRRPPSHNSARLQTLAATPRDVAAGIALDVPSRVRRRAARRGRHREQGA